MGLPAFDMSAFEAATTAVSQMPRATTSIFIGPGVARHAHEDRVREYIHNSVSAYILGIEKWNINAFSTMLNMREHLMTGMSRMPLSFHHEVIKHTYAYNGFVHEQIHHTMLMNSK